MLAAAAYSFWPGNGTSEPEGSETHGIAVVARSASAVGTAQALDPSLEIDPVGVVEHLAPATPSLEIDPAGRRHPAPAAAETAPVRG